MLGKSHMIIGGMSAVTLASLVKFGKEADFTSSIKYHTSNGLEKTLLEFNSFVNDVFAVAWEHIMPGDTFIFMFVGVMLSIVGSLLPDIDSSNSILGRHVKLKFKYHRGYTHTDWLWGIMLLVFIACGIIWGPGLWLMLFWLWVGAQSHLEVDGLSRMGRVRYYPFTAYKVVNLGDVKAVAPKGKHKGLYKVGKMSEGVVLIGLTFILFAIVCLVESQGGLLASLVR